MNGDNGSELRYCSPFHGGWDIARMALLIPESRILFICPSSCARIIALNALRSGLCGRLAVYGLSQQEIVMDDYAAATLDSMRRLIAIPGPRPKVMILFVSCIDSMLATDHQAELDTLSAEYPDIHFMLMRMNPICQHPQGQLPLFKLQQDIFGLLDGLGPADPRQVALIGSNLPLSPDSELAGHLADNGLRLTHISRCATYHDFQGLAKARLNLVTTPYGLDAAEMLLQKFATPYVRLSVINSFDAFDHDLAMICQALDIASPDLAAQRQLTVAALHQAAAALAGRPVVVDGSAVWHPLSLAALLADHGFNVQAVYVGTPVDAGPAVTQLAARGIEIIDAGHHVMPARRQTAARDIVAIGQLGGCFAAASHVVDLFCDSGLWGYQGLRRLAALMTASAAVTHTVGDIAREAERCTV